MEEVKERPIERVDLRVVWRLLEKNKGEFAPHGWPDTSLELQRITLRNPRVCREGSSGAGSESAARGGAPAQERD
jgi:hypothetical protein